MLVDDVRIGTPEDIEGIFHLMHLAWEEAGDHPMDEEKVLSRVIAAVQRQGSLIGVIGERGGPLKGYIYLIISDIWYSSSLQLLELSNFVHPDHRRSTFAKSLISFAKKSAEELGIDLTIGVISNHRTASKCRLYQRQVPKVGEYFVHKVEKRAATAL